MIGKPIGQTGFISSPITRVENAPEFQHCRPRGGERRDFRGTIPATPEQIEQAADYDSHAVARGGAARASARRVISNEEVIRGIATAAQAHSGQIDSPATLAQLEQMRTALNAQQAVIDRLQARIETIDSNQSIGDHKPPGRMNAAASDPIKRPMLSSWQSMLGLKRHYRSSTNGCNTALATDHPSPASSWIVTLRAPTRAACKMG